MFLIRNAEQDDLKGLLRLSRSYRTVNLPDSSRALRELLRRSERNFRRKSNDKPRSDPYIFVLEDLRTHRIIGSSQLIGRHGTSQNPHVYFEVMRDKAGSRRCYRLKADRRGYTEIGGLVLDPHFRGHEAKLGTQLSFVRFLFMRAHPRAFMRRVIAELLPPLYRGRSRLWEAYGRRLTKLSYQEADALSYGNTAFILRCFPSGDLYHDQLPLAVQKDMGQTGPGSTAAAHLLKKIGFRYAKQVDPFDGGPHYVALRAAIRVYRQTRAYWLGGTAENIKSGKRLLLAESDRGVRAVLAPSRVRQGKIYLSLQVARHLHVKAGHMVYTYSLRT